MDTMCMETALCSLTAVASILTSQVGLTTVTGVNSSSQVAPIPVDYVSGHSILSKKGGYVTVRMDLSAYKSRLEACKYSLIGRIVFSSGEKPWKLVDLKAKLQSVWMLNSVWRLISLGKGYFQIMLNSDVDKNMVRFYDLSWEYWHPKIISELARGIRVPLQLDRATVQGDFGYFTRVLMDVDVSIMPLSSLLLERNDSHSSFISVEYENLLDLGSLYSAVVHFSTGSDSVLSMGFSTSIVVSPSLTSSLGSTVSVVAAQVISAILYDSIPLTVSHDQQSGSVNVILIVLRSSTVVPVSNVLAVHDSHMDIRSDLSLDLSVGQVSPFLGFETILKSSSISGLVFDGHSTILNQALPVIDSLV
ncbi:hypothetical protein Ddye_021480 [Dipteronia dyeriana]|uniref:Uncharacterized protein n=1 Tax=Dipteronia dyeriana TaxID=168575 RepID=A0AAD9U2R4_9ROSI|nr:hypothetical protein Ddye_021480 [Dipteronia dyeriana]